MLKNFSSRTSSNALSVTSCASSCFKSASRWCRYYLFPLRSTSSLSSGYPWSVGSTLSPSFLWPKKPFSLWDLLSHCHEMCTWGGCLGTSYLGDMTVSSSGIPMAGPEEWSFVFSLFCLYFLPLPWIFSLREIWLPLSFWLRHVVCERKSPSTEDLGFETATLFA